MKSKSTQASAAALFGAGLIGLTALVAATPAAAIEIRADVVVDMTPMGENVPKPTREKPAYYLPVPGGYQELGGIFRRKVPPPPPEAEIEEIFTRALAEQGYLPATAKTPPSLIISYTWGRILPILVGRGKLAVVQNEADMLSMVAGDKLDARSTNHPSAWMSEILTNERRPQRFLKVMAFDYNAWKNHRTVLLWQALVTTPGILVTNIMPTLIEAAAPALGSGTARPIIATVPFIPPGSVIAGTPRYKSP